VLPGKSFHGDLTLENEEDLVGIGMLMDVRFTAARFGLKHRDKAIGRSGHIHPAAYLIAPLHRLGDVEDLHFVRLNCFVFWCHFYFPSREKDPPDPILPKENVLGSQVACAQRPGATKPVMGLSQRLRQHCQGNLVSIFVFN
jgi:hypothetical protein